jgi:glycosyltransferase involved in cell wall biosynthesis
MTLDDSPQVSVCVPTYLGAQHLPATINSVLEQSFGDFELVIIDDNSPDQTEQLVAKFHDPRIHYHRNRTNLGPEGNWNRCLQECKGQYFKLLPQDDLLYPDTLKRQVEILENDKKLQLALVFGKRNIIDTNDKVITQRGYPAGKEGFIPARQLIRRCVRFGTNLIGEPGGVLMRKSLTDRVGAFDGDISYVIDLDYWIRLLNFGNAYYLNEPVSTFRVFPGSWSVKIGTMQGKEYCQFINKLAKSSRHKINSIDCLMGKVNAHTNNIMRLIFYKFYLKKTS